jgi:hypothetical protein
MSLQRVAPAVDESGRATKLENEHRRKFFKEQAVANCRAGISEWYPVKAARSRAVSITFD